MKKAIFLFAIVASATNNAMLPTRDAKISRPLRTVFEMAHRNINDNPDQARKDFLKIEALALSENDRHWAAHARLWIGMLRLKPKPDNLFAFADTVAHFVKAQDIAPDDKQIAAFAQSMMEFAQKQYEFMTNDEMESKIRRSASF